MGDRLRAGWRRYPPERCDLRVDYVCEAPPSGYGTAGRRIVAGLVELGVDVRWVPAVSGGVGRLRRVGPSVVAGEDPRLDHALRPRSRRWRPDVVVCHTVPEHLPQVRSWARGVPIVAKTVWETDRLPHHWPALLELARAVVVPTEWNRAAFLACSVRRPVHVVPHAAGATEQAPGPLPLPVPQDALCFYTIGDHNDRKVPGLVVEAFVRAFGPADAVALVVKTSALDWTLRAPGPRRSSPAPALLAAMPGAGPHPPVLVATGHWSPRLVAALHARGDCYVSLARAEGWALGAFDAAVLGNPVVMTEFGAPLVYLDPARASLVRCAIVPVVHRDADMYAPDQSWAEPDLDDAVDRLRAVRADVVLHRERAASLARELAQRYTPAAVASGLLGVLRESLEQARAVSAG